MRAVEMRRRRLSDDRCLQCGGDLSDRHPLVAYCNKICKQRFLRGKVTKPCIVGGCNKQQDCGGFCSMHNHRMKKHGDPHYIKRPQNRGLKECSLEGCHRPHESLGYCDYHARKFRMYGDPLATGRKDLQNREAKCAIQDCQRAVGDGSNGLCRSCYRKTRHAAEPELYRSAVNARRRRLRQQMPKWADQNEIRDFYAACPAGFEVDHIVPLLGEQVSGLHVSENLQYLPVRENRKKANRHVH